MDIGELRELKEGERGRFDKDDKGISQIGYSASAEYSFILCLNMSTYPQNPAGEKLFSIIHFVQKYYYSLEIQPLTAQQLNPH